MWPTKRSHAARSDFGRLQEEFRRLLSPGAGAIVEFPPLRVYQGEEDATLTAELPGVASDSLEISVVDDTLTLRGVKQADAEGDGEVRYHRQERGHGQFTRTVRLPFRVAADGVNASLKHGVLTVHLPKAEEDKVRKITVQAS